MLSGQVNDNKENIRVIVRIRPRLEQEYMHSTSLLKVDGNNIIITQKNESKQFTYDYVATEDSTQSEIFEQCAKGICDSTLQGYNGTIFAYGQTGAGKTYTLLGPKYSQLDEQSPITNGLYRGYFTKREEDTKGLLPRVIEYLFDKSKVLENSHITFSCSFLEIYQEQVSDLLDNAKLVTIRDLSDSVVVDGLTKIPVASTEETLSMVIRGLKLRHVAKTGMNNESSRSHAVFSIYMENKTVQSKEGKKKTKKSVFHLIDLAGSERQKFTEASGDRLKEAGKINKSLMQLGHVIKTLLEIAEGKSRHVHYRDSKLTHLLKDSLGGNSKTCIIANITNNLYNNETLSTLTFAQSAKLIKNKAVINEELTSDAATFYREEIKKLREKYNSIKAENLYLITVIEKADQNKYSNKPNDFGKTLDYVEEEIETMVNEMNAKEEQIKILRTENEYLTSQLQRIELELKLKEKELREHKEITRTINQEHEVLRSQLKDYVLKDANMTRRIAELENLLLNKETLLQKEIESLKETIEDRRRVIESKEGKIYNLNEELKHYQETIANKDIKIKELKTQIESNEKEIEEVKRECEEYIHKTQNLQHEMENVKTNLFNKESEIRSHEDKFQDFKKKGKNLIDQYDSKIESLKLKQMNLEADLKKAKMEVKNLNLLIGEIKKDRDASEEKSFQSFDELKRIMLEKENLKEDNLRLTEDNRIIRQELIKLTEEVELLSENKNVNNNKVSLLNKTKQENAKLKEELNELRKNYDNIQKHIRSYAKTSTIDIAALLANKEAELNESRRCIHNSMLRIKAVFEGNDEFSFTLTENMKNFIESKTLEEKFTYYMEKLLKYQEVVLT